MPESAPPRAVTAPGPGRRGLLAAGAGALVTAGCAGPSASTAVPGDPAAPPLASSLRLTALADLPVGEPVVFAPADGPAVVLVRLGAGVAAGAGAQSVRAFSAVCPHHGCLVEVLRGDLVCPCHNSRFVPTTGARIRGLAPHGLAPAAVRVADGQVWLLDA